MSPLPARGTLAGGEPEALLRQVYEAWQADWAQWQVDRAELAVTQTALTSTQAELTSTQAELQEAGAQIAQLTARVEELEKPAKTPENSSTPPSKAPKGNTNGKNKKKKKRRRRKGRPGQGRPLHPDPDRTVDAHVSTCPHCQADLAASEQKPHAVYDRIELPPVRPDVTRVRLHGGRCPQCGRLVMARPPPGLERGSPFGASIVTLAFYLHYAQAISLERLRALFREVFQLTISEGALVNLFRRARPRFQAQTAALRKRLRTSRMICSDETSARVEGRTWWEWVFVGDEVVLHEVAPTRGKRVPQEVLAGARPAIGVADLFGSQQGHGEHMQVCLAHQMRDVRYALEAGDTIFAPGMKAFLERAFRLGQKRERVQDRTLARHRRDMLRRLDALLELEPTQADGLRLRKRYRKVREQLLVFLSEREVPPTNNVSERALRPSTIFRKVTNGFRAEWGAELYGAVRSGIATGRLHGLSALGSLRATLEGRSLLPAPAAEEPGPASL